MTADVQEGTNAKQTEPADAAPGVGVNGGPVSEAEWVPATARWDLLRENERRVGSTFLVLAIVSIVYWLSFSVFLDDPNRRLIERARSYADAVTRIEREQMEWQAQFGPKITQVVVVGNAYAESLQIRGGGATAERSILDVAIEPTGSGAMTMELVSELGQKTYRGFVREWARELDRFTAWKFIHLEDPLRLRLPYLVVNQPPGWLRVAAQGFGLTEDEIAAIPPELDELAWIDWVDHRDGAFFTSRAEFAEQSAELQTFHQTHLEDLMATETTGSQSGRRLVNLDWARDLASGIAESEPNIRLPVVGENLTGRWAFRVAGIFYVVCYRYFRRLAERLRELLVGPPMGPVAVSTAGASAARRYSPFPHLLNIFGLTRGMLDRRPLAIGTVDRCILAGLLLFPVSTVIPVLIVNWEIEHGAGRWFLVVVAAPYSLILTDTIRVLRLAFKSPPPEG